MAIIPPSPPLDAIIVPARARFVAPSALPLLLQISYHTDSQLNGYCTVPVSELARELGVHIRTARKAIATLKAAGLVSQRSPLHLDGRKFRHAYRVEFWGNS